MNSLRIIDGRCYKECDLVMLASETSLIALHKGRIYLSKTDPYTEGIDYSPIHLYILSNDKIEKGDWVLYETNQIERADTEYIHAGAYNGKIVATTNTDCDFELLGGKGIYTLPELPYYSIRIIIDHWNEGETVEKVLVEYEHDEITKHLLNTENRHIEHEINYVPKVNSEYNTINISKVTVGTTTGRVE
jgi:hypothetical protein